MQNFTNAGASFRRVKAFASGDAAHPVLSRESSFEQFADVKRRVMRVPIGEHSLIPQTVVCAHKHRHEKKTRAGLIRQAPLQKDGRPAYRNVVALGDSEGGITASIPGVIQHAPSRFCGSGAPYVETPLFADRPVYGMCSDLAAGMVINHYSARLPCLYGVSCRAEGITPHCRACGVPADVDRYVGDEINLYCRPVKNRVKYQASLFDSDIRALVDEFGPLDWDRKLFLYSGGCMHAPGLCLLCDQLSVRGGFRDRSDEELKDEVKSEIFWAHVFIESEYQPFGSGPCSFQEFMGPSGEEYEGILPGMVGLEIDIRKTVGNSFPTVKRW